MSDYYLSGEMRTGERLIISPITSEVAAAHNMEVSESVGYFLYQKSNADPNASIEILARVPTEDAVFELGRLLGLS